MLSFDNAPTVWWFAGYVLAGIVFLLSFLNRFSDRIFLALALLLVAFMRLPVIVFNRELSIDESQMLSHAITLFQDPVYWKSVDGTTIGPLDNYLLIVPRLLGFQINYTSGRVMGLLCMAGALFFLFLTLRKWSGQITSRVAFLAPVFLLAFTQEPDLVHYSSEQLPVFMLALCLWFFARISRDVQPSLVNAYLLGFFAGAVPFAKLQAAPQAAVIAASALWIFFMLWRRRGILKPSLFLLAGGFTFPLIVLVLVSSLGLMDDMISFYLLGNAIYASGSTWLDIPSQLISVVNASADFQVFAAALAAPALAGIFFIFKKLNKKEADWVPGFAMLLLVFASIYAVTKSGNDFAHYLNFCIAPLTLLAAFGMQRKVKWNVAFAAIVLCWFAGNNALHYTKERLLNRFPSVGARTLNQSPVVVELKKYVQKGDYMTVWGWQCAYYVEAQLAQGTAENHSERSIFMHPLRDTYRQRYLRDIERTQPAVILDAVGKNSLWVQDKARQGIESFPELFEHIKTRYRLVGDFDDTRLYVRNDRIRSNR